MNLADTIELACLMEATARKPGNVHPGASFVDLCYEDFAQAAADIAPVIAQATPDTLGMTVLRAIEATQQHARTNINLGIVLLLTPLAAVPQQQYLWGRLPDVLDHTTQRDAADVYHAIRFAHPGGLGKAEDQDVADEPTQTLREVMRLAADRDLIAAQYANGFALVQGLSATIKSAVAYGLYDRRTAAFESGPPMLPWEAAVITIFLHLLVDVPDSLIVRKNGLAIAQETQQRAAAVLRAGWPFAPASATAFQHFDTWLRADGHRRNPGTSADLIAAALFAVLREGWIEPPTKSELQAHAAAIQRA